MRRDFNSIEVGQHVRLSAAIPGGRKNQHELAIIQVAEVEPADEVGGVPIKITGTVVLGPHIATTKVRSFEGRHLRGFDLLR